MGLFSNRLDRESLKPGDHIYSWRAAYIYAHHGIYVVENKVIHFTRHGQETGTGSVFDVLRGCSAQPPSLIPCPNCTPTKNTSPNCTPTKNTHGVITSCLDCFLSGGVLYRFEYSANLAVFMGKARGGTCTLAASDPPETTLHRANYLLDHGFGCYNVFKNNCVDFALYCKTGLLVLEKKSMGQIGQPAIGGTLTGVVSVLFKVAKAKSAVFMSVATLYTSRYTCDFGIRSDVIKVDVEDLPRR